VDNRVHFRKGGHMADETEALLASQGESSRGATGWVTEIKEAIEARKEAQEHHKDHPRPLPPRGMMQRSGGSDRIRGKARSITPIMPIGTIAKS
jgi:hypothetical protein